MRREDAAGGLRVALAHIDGLVLMRGDTSETDVAQTLGPVFADLHVHIGRSQDGKPVKISGSKDLTFSNIAREASERKGIELVGVIDCHSPAVQAEMEACLASGDMQEVEGGGIRYRRTTIVPGIEMEVKEEGGGPFHLLGYLPTLAAMKEWTAWLKPRVTNISLSSQRVRASARELQRELLDRGGLLVPAHVFTPHRGLLGCSADRLSDRLDLDGIAAVELGLSADTAMAGTLSQLDAIPFLTNSDAHSVGMIGRECNELLLAEPSFAEFAKALKGADGRHIVANYGLHPRLGKYHTTYCRGCGKAVSSAEATTGGCPFCGSHKLVRGVEGRISQLADRKAAPSEVRRPPYRAHVPLSFFPGIGPATREKLFTEAGTEMDVLHRLPESLIASVAGSKAAALIIAAREGRLDFVAGNGGTYGAIVLS
ncbi:endonuclease Q family protein [Cohnella soli]|uniref:Endonuclease Q family protein n=1 Tax=Cohnella soli TaxID=425005 RepID=A0ABW0HTK1_9BACL